MNGMSGRRILVLLIRLVIHSLHIWCFRRQPTDRFGSNLLDEVITGICREDYSLVTCSWIPTAPWPLICRTTSAPYRQTADVFELKFCRLNSLWDSSDLIIPGHTLLKYCHLLVCHWSIISYACTDNPLIGSSTSIVVKLTTGTACLISFWSSLPLNSSRYLDSDCLNRFRAFTDKPLIQIASNVAKELDMPVNIKVCWSFQFHY